MKATKFTPIIIKVKSTEIQGRIDYFPPEVIKELWEKNNKGELGKAIKNLVLFVKTEEMVKTIMRISVGTLLENMETKDGTDITLDIVNIPSKDNGGFLDYLSSL